MRAKIGKRLTGNFRRGIEREIKKYRGDHYLWHKHVTGVDLNPHQVAWMNEMDRKGDSHLLIGSRRIRKSFTAAAYLLEDAACLPYCEINVHSPALEQSKRNLRYKADMVLNSEILLAYLDERLGEGIGKEHIEFLNRSLIQAKGQASSVDGLGATHQWYEEFDDMEWDTVLTRIWPTGSQIKDDHDYGGHDACFRVVTGTIKGIGNIHALEYPDDDILSAGNLGFNTLPKLNCWHGIAMGIIPENDILQIRAYMTPHQFGRTYLVVYVESSAFYPDKWVRGCQDYEFLPVSVALDPDFKYYATGEVTIGIDAAGAGSGDDSSQWAVTFTERVGNHVFWLYSKEWDSNERPDVVRDDLVKLIAFFKPQSGFGDAFDTAFLYDLNRKLYSEGVTRIDVRRFPNKQGKEGWDRWYIRPLRFTGPAKHAMHERMQKYVYSGTFRYPAIVEDDDRYTTLEKLIRQLGNIKAERTLAGYNKYEVLNLRLGDDIVDSCICSVWAHEEITVHVVPHGGMVPQMDIGGRPLIQPLGPAFLNDGRRQRPNEMNKALELLRGD